MLVTIDSKALNMAIDLAIGAVATRSIHPVLGHLKLEAKENCFSVAGFDLSVGIRFSVPVEVSEDGSVCVPPKLFKNLVSKLDGEIQLELDDKLNLSIIAENSQNQITCTSADDFYDFQNMTDFSSVALSAIDLKESLKLTMTSVSNDESKLILTGINLDCNGEELNFASTDGHRLSVVKKGVLEKDNKFNLTIPAKSLALLNKIIEESDEIEIKVNNGEALIETDRWTFFTRIIEGNYPQYAKLIPGSFKTTVYCDRKALINCIEIASVFNDAVVICEFNGSKIIVKSESQTGTSSSSISSELEGINITVAFQAAYLLQGLKQIESAEVKIKINAELQPVLIFSKNDESQFYLVMPIQVRK